VLTSDSEGPSVPVQSPVLGGAEVELTGKEGLGPVTGIGGIRGPLPGTICWLLPVSETMKRSHVATHVHTDPELCRFSHSLHTTVALLGSLTIVRNVKKK
jgi:hypothetical protein